MHPRARAFRTRPGQSFAPSTAIAAAPSAPAVQDTSAPATAPATDPDPTTEALTGRQLRMARRIAQKHGIKAASDLDAVRQLRERGIDPFERANMLQLVPNAPDEGAAGVPAARREAPAPAMPTDAPLDDAGRAAEIMEIQRDIVRRRRRRLALLGVRLAFFVGLPTAIAGYYYNVIATPMYATNSTFIIQQADLAAGGANLGGLFAGTGLASQQDSIAVQDYLLSREAYRRLDEDLGFRAHFSDPDIDPLQRLDTDATREQGYELYTDMVQIGYDPTEGVVKLEVVAADPTVSARFSQSLIDYAEERVDQLTARLRGDQMEGASDSFEEAERKMLEAQSRVVQLQEQLGVVSAEAELSNAYGQIGTIETQLREERLRLDELLANRRPNQTRVDIARSRIAQLDQELARLREGLTDAGTDAASLARVTAELGVAQMDLQTRQLLLQQAAQQLETARIEANRQVRYLSTSRPPVPPDQPTYPKAFENTVLAFLIFGAIYLMISLTVAILREQVSG